MSSSGSSSENWVWCRRAPTRWQLRCISQAAVLVMVVTVAVLLMDEWTWAEVCHGVSPLILKILITLPRQLSTMRFMLIAMYVVMTCLRRFPQGVRFGSSPAAFHSPINCSMRVSMLFLQCGP